MVRPGYMHLPSASAASTEEAQRAWGCSSKVALAVSPRIGSCISRSTAASSVRLATGSRCCTSDLSGSSTPSNWTLPTTRLFFTLQAFGCDGPKQKPPAETDAVRRRPPPARQRSEIKPRAILVPLQLQDPHSAARTRRQAPETSAKKLLKVLTTTAENSFLPAPCARNGLCSSST